MTSKRRAGYDGRYEWRKCTVGKQIDMRIRGLLATACLAPTPALAQALNYTTFGNPGSLVTTVTGIRGNGMTGDFTTGTGGSTAGVFYTLPSLTPAPYPNASAPPVNFTGATTNTPYGPSFGSATGILRVVGSYKTTANGNGDLGYLFDGANAPGQQLTTLIGGPGAFNTIAHSNFGNQVVGNWDLGNANVGNAFLYNIATGSMTTINRPGPYTSTTAYGVYGDHIAGGSSLGPGLSRAYILNQTTGVYTDYDAPGTGTVVTHFEGITGGGRANTYNLVADSVDATGTHAWVAHIDANGNATWTELSVLPGNTSSTTSANSIYGSTAIGVYTLNGVTYAFTTTVPGIYNPITNNGTLSSGTVGATLIAGVQGDDIVNNGTVTTTGAGSVGLNINTYGVATNNGTVNASGAGSSGVLMSGSFSSLLNYGTITAAPGSFAIQTDSTAVGSLIYNTGVINGAVSIAAGPYARFENSGWMGITAPGAGVTHAISGTFAQTSLGTLALRVGSNGVSDQLVVNGQARLAGTALAVFQPGITFAKSYTLVSATNGLTGTFGTLSTQNLPGFLGGSLGYSPTSVTLNLQASLARLSGLGDHQRSVGQALDTAFNAGSGLGAMPALFSLTAAQIPYALTVLSGSNASVGLSTDMMAGSQFTSLMTSRSLTRHADQQTAELAACDQAAACQVGAYEAPPNWSAWATAFGGGQWLNAEPTSGAPAAQQSIGGGAFGGDFRVGPQTVLGAAAGVSVSNYGVSYTGANGRATGAHFGLYGLHDMGTFYVNGSLAYNRFDGSATRVVAGIGSTETEKSSAVSSQLAGRLEVGRPFEVAKFETGQMGVTPFVAFQPAQLWTPAYTEWSVTQNGAPGVFALSYQAQGTTSLPTFLGAQLDGETMVNARPLKGWVRAAWVHEFMPERGVTAGFTVLPGSTFSVDGARAASNAARLELGVKYAVGAQTSLFTNSNVELSDRGQSVGATVGLRIVW
jgi:subtilase-type serine protease